MVLTLFALGGAQCALTAVIALKTQKNEKKFLKKVQICIYDIISIVDPFNEL